MGDIIKVKEYSKKNVGKMIKNTKIKYTWMIVLNNETYTLDLFDSKMSNKYRIFINDEQQNKEGKIINNKFQEVVSIKNHKIKILKNQNDLEFYINDKKIDYENLDSNDINVKNEKSLNDTNDDINKIEFISTFKTVFSKNMSEYIGKKEAEIDEKPDYYYI